MKPIPALLPFSWVYGSIVWLRNLFFDIGIFKVNRVAIPVVSVGNITAGGTGKTPFVEFIANFFLQQKKKVAVISRGYGRKSKGLHIVCNGEKILCDVQTSGDEAYLLSQKLQHAIVIVDEDRFRAAKKAVDELQADVILLDDGFQHRQLYRNLDIVLNNTQRSAFATPMIPAGYRREPLHSLRRADAVVWTKSDGKEISQREFRYAGGKKIFSGAYELAAIEGVLIHKKIDVEQLKKKPVFAFCGIAQPESFKQILMNAEMLVMKFKPFNDHHEYTRDNVLELVEEWKAMSSGIVLTTEKDAVKLLPFEKELGHIPLFKVVMNIRIHQQTEWEKLLLKVLEK